MAAQKPDMVVGLRVDVDTLRGTRKGVPSLLKILQRRNIAASFFFSVGPDNMGRHLWRLIRPTFLVKMIRSKAARLYGWDIILRGVFWPGPNIGTACDSLMRLTAENGHEVGLHAWDHHKWQVKLDRMTASQLHTEIDLGVSTLGKILGFRPTCSASAGWRCSEAVLLQKQEYKMNYHSDCRGESIFRPVVAGEPTTPQIPVTLPTYDELIGRNGISDENYNAAVLDEIKPERLNVLTIHAEVEGIAKRELFEKFLDSAAQRGVKFLPLGALLPIGDEIAPGAIDQAPLNGRDGAVCVQILL